MTTPQTSPRTYRRIEIVAAITLDQALRALFGPEAEPNHRRAVVGQVNAD